MWKECSFCFVSNDMKFFDTGKERKKQRIYKSSWKLSHAQLCNTTMMVPSNDGEKKLKVPKNAKIGNHNKSLNPWVYLKIDIAMQVYEKFSKHIHNILAFQKQFMLEVMFIPLPLKIFRLNNVGVASITTLFLMRKVSFKMGHMWRKF